MLACSEQTLSSLLVWPVYVEILMVYWVETDYEMSDSVHLHITCGQYVYVEICNYIFRVELIMKDIRWCSFNEFLLY